MASHIGLIYRNEAAQTRIDTAFAAVVAGGIALPPMPPKTRDPKENETLRLEWIAAALEAVGDTVRPAPAKKAAKK